MDESSAAAMAAAPPGTTNGVGVIQSAAGPTTYDKSEYQATPHVQDDAAVAPGAPYGDQFEDVPEENTHDDRHLEDASSSPASMKVAANCEIIVV